MSVRINKGMKVWGILGGLALLVAARAPAEGDVPAKLQAAIVAKVLEYDRAVPARSGGKIAIGVITDSASLGAKQALAEGFELIQKNPVQNLPLKIIPIHLPDTGSLEQPLEAAGANVLFATGRCKESTLAAVLAFARKKKIPACTDKAAWVAKGFVLGIVEESGRARIVVKLTEMKAQGMDLPAQLLQLARIIK